MSETRRYRKFSAQQKTELVLASLRGPKTIAQLCREHDISETLLRSGASSSWPPAPSGCRARRSAPRPTSCAGRSPARARVGAQDDGGGGRGGTLAGMGVSMRVARSRELVAQGRPAAVVARVAGISRQAIYRRPAGRRRDSGRRVDAVDRVVLDIAAGRTRPTARGWSPRSRRAGATRPVSRKRVQRLMRAHRSAGARVRSRGTPAPPRRLPGHAARRALASRHDPRSGWPSTAGPVLSETRRSTAAPARGCRSGAGRQLPRHRGDRSHRPGDRRAWHGARAADARSDGCRFYA